jgi:hypothetical protein
MRGVGRVSGGGAASGAVRGGGRGGGFSVGLAAGGAMRGAAAAGAMAPLGLGMLSLQESGGGAERDAAARRRAESLLEELDGLQAELLDGRRDTGRLARLAALEEGEAGADPGLREAVQAIVLRARIELARRGWNESASGT